MIKVRCSALPRIELCPPSAARPTADINHENEYSRMGSATHRLFSGVIEKKPNLLEDVATAFRLDMDDLKRSFGMLLNAWGQVQEWFPAPMSERPLEFRDEQNGITLTGTCDLLSIVGNEARVADWKTGFNDGDHTAQIKGYCLAACKEFDCQTAYGAVLQTRLRGGEAQRWTREELEIWWSGLAAKIKNHEHVSPTPGPQQCKYCPSWSECDAGKKYLRRAADAFFDLPADGPLTPDHLIELSEQRQMIEGRLKQIQDLIKTEVINQGGSVVSSDGRKTLTISEYNQRPISYAEAEPILRPELGERFSECVKITKTELEKIVGELAPRGRKGTAIKQLFSRLDEAGAIGIETLQKLELKRIKS